jgi:hypothetical protein
MYGKEVEHAKKVQFPLIPAASATTSVNSQALNAASAFSSVSNVAATYTDEFLQLQRCRQKVQYKRPDGKGSA